MIIGNGLLAKKFIEYSDSNIVIFASGVSNSLETRDSEFLREKTLLLKIINETQGDIVYFGSCSIFDESVAETPYVKHKLEMELLIRKNRKNHYILRLAQVVGKAENNTLINFLYNKLINNEQFDIWTSASRNLISTDLILKISRGIITGHEYGSYNLAYFESEGITEIYQVMCTLLGVNGCANYLDKGHSYNIPLGQVEVILEQLAVTRDKNRYYSDLIEEFFEKLGLGIYAN